MAGKTNCECCDNYILDEDYGYYVCQWDLDEDEMIRFLTDRTDHCPHFQFKDEYRIVRKQM